MTEVLRFRETHEELSHLRDEALRAEQSLEKSGESNPRERAVREALEDFKNNSSHHDRDSRMLNAEKEAIELKKIHGDAISLEKMISVTEEKGVFHALHVAEKLKDWKIEDDFHDFLVDLVTQGMKVRGVKEGGPVYKALDMTLYEIILTKKEDSEKPLSELLRSMEQLYAGLLTIGEKKNSGYLAFEVANPEGEEDTRAFVSVPSGMKNLFERQLHSIFPDAEARVRERDYNIFSEEGVALGASARLVSSPAYPLKAFDEFGHDPLNVILSGFSQIPKKGAGAALQIIFRPAGDAYNKKYAQALESIKKGKKPKEVLKEESIAGEIARTLGEGFFGKKERKEDEPPQVDDAAVAQIQKKLLSQIVETNIRLVAAAETEPQARQLLGNFQSAFNQFENTGFQNITWEKAGPSKKREGDFYRSFSFRLWRPDEAVPLNLHELSTLLHFHTEALSSSSNLSRKSTRSAPPPTDLASEGTLLGTSNFQGREREIRIAPEDRLRHFYTIGQTGTGKSTLLKNMIISDIKAGEGVAMIDPHGSDVLDVLRQIPPERVEDVIYFDPGATERPMALNMLEYDPRFPEQKTFVVNELFSIFQKLYGGVPESMGPMFEQYFRNATMLVIEDPETGSTLLDVSRVLSNREYREQKLSRCQNPVVRQFWTEVATKAGGEAALANIVPYVTSKFDVFLANDIMRPIVAQEKSSWNFREIMDKKKILLVNLSKGRLGEINANLIGLILVGKILMASLSRADSPSADLPPFYLYIDEFQNITTSSISTILSEARKYKLSLTMAHQFIAQLEEKVRDSIFGNVGSLCAFRVGNDDAEYLERIFSPVFGAQDLSNTDNFNACIKLLVSGRPREPFNIRITPPREEESGDIEALKRMSYEKYGKPREEIEAAIREKYKSIEK